MRPAWSPDGRVIAVFGGTGAPRTQIVFVDAASGSEVVRDSRGSFMPYGVTFMDAASILLSQPAEIGFTRATLADVYPDGAVSRLTNDVNSYLGAGLDADRSSLVTSRSEMRAAIWLGDGAARSGAEVVPPTLLPCRSSRVGMGRRAPALRHRHEWSALDRQHRPAESGHRWKSHRTQTAPSRHRTERRLCS